MRLMLRLAMTLAALAWPVEALRAKQCHNTHEVLTMSLRENMVGKARLNGETVTDVMLKNRCLSGFATRSGVTWIDWTTVNNEYPSGLEDSLTLKIPRNGRFDVVTYEGDPHVAVRIFMSLGLLQGDCYDHGRFC